MTSRPLSSAPVAIGGVGGSGTRLVARFLLDLGFFLGADLNEENDNLWFTLLFKRPEILRAPAAEIADLVTIFVQAMDGRSPSTAPPADRVAAIALEARPGHDVKWLAERARSLRTWQGRAVGDTRPWGWKEPNTHAALHRIAPLLPGLRYIHVVRNGLDMAYSSNQNQLRLWGPEFLGRDTVEASPRLSLKFWRAVQERAEQAKHALGERFLVLDYDRLCMEPEGTVGTLLSFLGLNPTSEVRARLLSSIRVPRSVGRFRKHPPEDLDPDDVAFAREMGFDTSYRHPDGGDSRSRSLSEAG